ncbi:MAG: SDR family oxidoreductase [Rubrivivax sp.]
MSSNMLDFSGKSALVVGGSSGIGNAIAQALRAQGAQVHVWGTRASPAGYAGEPGSDLAGLHYTQVDVADGDAIRSAPPQLESLDVLVLSQGMVLYQRQEFDEPGFRRVLDVNLTSLMTCCMRFFEPLKAARGAVVVISSTAAFHSTKGNPAYNASKAGALGLTRTLGEAWAPLGIRVNGLAPGMVETKMTRVTTEHPKRRQAFLDKIPAGRLGVPDDIAGPALFLASPLSAYMIGQTLPVDGGLILT